MREEHGIATGFLLDVPDVPQKSMLIMVNRLAVGAIQITVLNFAENEVSGPVISPELPVGGTVVDLATGAELGTVDALGSFQVSLPGFGGVALLVKDPAGSE